MASISMVAAAARGTDEAGSDDADGASGGTGSDGPSDAAEPDDADGASDEAGSDDADGASDGTGSDDGAASSVEPRGPNSRSPVTLHPQCGHAVLGVGAMQPHLGRPGFGPGRTASGRLPVDPDMANGAPLGTPSLPIAGNQLAAVVSRFSLIRAFLPTRSRR